MFYVYSRTTCNWNGRNWRRGVRVIDEWSGRSVFGIEKLRNEGWGLMTKTSKGNVIFMTWKLLYYVYGCIRMNGRISGSPDSEIALGKFFRQAYFEGLKIWLPDIQMLWSWWHFKALATYKAMQKERDQSEVVWGSYGRLKSRRKIETGKPSDKLRGPRQSKGYIARTAPIRRLHRACVQTRILFKLY